MVGVYFSGTGNTEYCIRQYVNQYDEAAPVLSIEEAATLQAIEQNDFIVFAYPVFYSNLPKIVRDFMEANKKLFLHKKIFIIATMALFSGDGTGCAARLFRKYGQLTINQSTCIRCGRCCRICPMDNLEMQDKLVKTKGLCTECYRCVSNCPAQAITLLGNKVYEQCKIERYLRT